MANCSNYLMLSPKERVEMIGRIVHSLQSDNEIFNKCEMLIDRAERKGLFEGVTINPSDTIKENEE